MKLLYNTFLPKLKFTSASSKKRVVFLHLYALLGMGQLLQIYTLRAQMSPVNISPLELIMNKR